MIITKDTIQFNKKENEWFMELKKHFMPILSLQSNHETFLVMLHATFLQYPDAGILFQKIYNDSDIKFIDEPEFNKN